MKHTDKEYVQRCIDAHKAAFEEWTYGEVAQTWTDKDGYLCVRYTGSDRFWRYTEAENGEIIWW